MRFLPGLGGREALGVAAGLGASILAAMAFRRWVELPALRLADRCRLRPTAPRTPAPDCNTAAPAFAWA